jgi:hypothetical protein
MGKVNGKGGFATATFKTGKSDYHKRNQEQITPAAENIWRFYFMGSGSDSSKYFCLRENRYELEVSFLLITPSTFLRKLRIF